VAGLEYAKSQHEASLRLAAETCQAMSNDLLLERGRVQELEARLADLYPSIESMLHCLNQSLMHHVSQESTRSLQQLQEENQRQREQLIQLQATLHIREEMVQELRTTLAEAFLGFSAENHSSVNSNAHIEQQDDSSSVDIITMKTEGDDGQTE
jgi:chromosome segregation ATPase